MKGTIYIWYELKGYGFIEVENSKRRVFAHISDFYEAKPMPRIGDEVSFELFSNPEKEGKFAAKKIRYVKRKHQTSSAPSQTPRTHFRQPEYDDDEKTGLGDLLRASLDGMSKAVIWVFLILALILGGYYFYLKMNPSRYKTQPVTMTNTQQFKPTHHKAQDEPQFNDNYQSEVKTNVPSKPIQAAPKLHHNQAQTETPKFQCDGRNRCYQMTSCEEAIFFLNHCGATEMDGSPPGKNYPNEPDGIPCESTLCTAR